MHVINPPLVIVRNYHIVVQLLVYKTIISKTDWSVLMKKINLFFCMCLMVLSLFGCGNANNTNSTNTKNKDVENKTEVDNKTETEVDNKTENEIVNDNNDTNFPHMDISFTVLGTNFNEYALKKNMKFIDVTSNINYVCNAGLILQTNDILYADLAKTDYEGYIVNDGLIKGKIVPLTFYNSSLASYLASEIDITTLDVPLVIPAGNKVHYLWECDNGYFTALVLVTDDKYNYNLNYILLEVAYYSDLEHCLWGDNIDYFLNQQREDENDKQSTEPNTEQTTQDNQVDNNTNSSELEQSLFNSINYALSIGMTSNCDMSQKTLKELYEKIEDGTFFEESMFSYVAEYGKDRYNYEITYDSLNVIVYCDYTTSLYGFEIEIIE